MERPVRGARTALGVSALLGLLAAGCALSGLQGFACNVRVSGSVRWSHDSTEVEGALVTVTVDSLSMPVYTDSTGYYEYRETFMVPDGGREMVVVVGVSDPDLWAGGGHFRPEDTVFHEDVSEDNWNLEYSVDFCVTAVEEATIAP